MLVARVLDQVVDKELGRTLHERVGGVAQELLVAGVEVVPPQMLAEPRAAARPDAVVRGVDRGGAAPEIEVVVQHPAAARRNGRGPFRGPTAARSPIASNSGSPHSERLHGSVGQ